MEERKEKIYPRLRVISATLLIILVFCIAAVAYLKTNGSDIDFPALSRIAAAAGISEAGRKDSTQAGREKVIEIPYVNDRNTDFAVYDSMIAKCTADGIKLLDMSGAEIKNFSLSLSYPFMKTNGKDLLVAEKGGKSIYVIRGNSIKWEKKTDSSIINADISDDGFVSVVQKSSGYKNKVSVFDQNGIERFYRNLAENRVISAIVAPSAEQMALLTLNASGIMAESGLQFLDSTGQPLYAATLDKDETFAIIGYLDDDSLFCSSGKTFILYDHKITEKWRKTTGRVFSIAAYGRTVVAAYQEKQDNATVIGFFNSRGKKTAECKLSEEIKNISVYSGIAAVNTTREVYFINSSGKITGRYGSASDIKNVFFFNKLEALIIKKDSIVVTDTHN